MSRSNRNGWGLLCFAIFVMGISVQSVHAKDRPKPMHAIEYQKYWYLQNGEDKPLCKQLLKIAKSHKAFRGVLVTIPWNEVLAIPGIKEPAWRELNPAEYEQLFMVARRYLQAEKEDALEITSFERWFKPLEYRERMHESPKEPLSDQEALETYRDFVHRGGRMKTFRYDAVGDGKTELLYDLVQYELPTQDVAQWDGYTLQTKPGLAEFQAAGYPKIDIGYQRRILKYGDAILTFERYRWSGAYTVYLFGPNILLDESTLSNYCEISLDANKLGRTK